MDNEELDLITEKMCKSEAIGGLISDWSGLESWDQVYDIIMNASDFPDELTLTDDMNLIDFLDYKEKLEDEYHNMLIFSEKIKEKTRESMDLNKASEREIQAIYEKYEGENEYKFIVSETRAKELVVKADTEDEAYEILREIDCDGGFTYADCDYLSDSSQVYFNGMNDQEEGMTR